MTGSDHFHWKGGRSIDRYGYMLILTKKGNKRRYVKEHRIVAEKMLGRKLKRNEDVHHKNGIKTDNRPENLEVLTRSEHSKISYQLRKINNKGQLL
jgi:hypothetical protein